MGLSRLLVCFCVLVAAVSVDGQIGAGQGYPPGGYPPGQYPNGRNPNGTSPGQQGQGPSIPRIGRKKSNTKKPDVAMPDFFADAEVVSVDAKQLVADTDDGRTLTLSVVPQTVWQIDGKPSTLASMKPEMGIHIEAAENDESFLTALTINVTAERMLRKRPVQDDGAAEPAAAPNQPQTQTAEADNATPASPTGLGAPPDDPDRPRLTRGKPKASASASASHDDDDEPPSKTAATKTPDRAVAKKAAPSPDGSVDFTIDAKPDPKRQAGAGVPALIAQTMDWVGTFSNGLPNYLCQQLTTRYVEFSKDDGWQAQDVITAKMVYEDGKENYQDITVGGKRVNKGMLELGGSTSTGEYAATMRALFWPGTKTEFHFAKSSTMGETAVSVYNYTVDLPHSNWTIKVGGQVLRPAYSGEVWVNKTTGEVRKIEMSADNIPKNFPMRSIYSSVAYDPVRLGTATFLLPVVSVNQSCERKSSTCSKNDVEWRNYQKFSGKSTIVFN